MTAEVINHSCYAPENDEVVMEPSNFPQPKNGSQTYTYCRWDKVEETFFPTLEAETLVWVMQSKGKRTNSRKLYTTARVETGEVYGDEDRVMVRYSNGKTYGVRRTFLMPVLEHQSNLVLVVPETVDYRRCSVVHTLEEETFVEVGCDYGITTNMVRAKTRIGIDRSEESIRIAKETYPDCQFILSNIFQDELPVEVESTLVVAMDINGNRNLPAVLDCLQIIMDKWSPRLVVVKARSLYSQVVANSMG